MSTEHTHPDRRGGGGKEEKNRRETAAPDRGGHKGKEEEHRREIAEQENPIQKKIINIEKKNREKKKTHRSIKIGQQLKHVIFCMPNE